MDGNLHINRSILFVSFLAVIGGRFLLWVLLPVITVRITDSLEMGLIFFMVGLGIYLGIIFG